MRIGLTMRVVLAPGYDEPRDALAQDWAPFLARALPAVTWVPLPNTGEAVLTLVDELGLEGFLFTGGNDLGENARRDATERALLATALDRNLPVFGVCRGLQLFQDFFGGRLERIGGHAGERHVVRRLDLGRPGLMDAVEEGGDEIEVNSFHHWGLPEPAPGLRPFALDPDGRVEGAMHESKRLAGVLWHPERERTARPDDLALLRAVFGFGGMR